MANYSMEDIEFIRRKSGISYQEAVSLLDYHNGDLARAVVDLERQGKIKSPESAKSSESSFTASGVGKKGLSFLQKLFRIRFKVSKGETSILNLSLLFTIFGLLISPHLAVIGLILSLILGYRITFDSKDPAFMKENLEGLVRNAAENVKHSVSGIARDIGNAVSQADQNRKSPSASGTQPVEASPAEAEPQQTAPETQIPVKEYEEVMGKEDAAPSFYTGGSASFIKNPGNIHADVPVMQIPVRTESADGSVSYQEDSDGYHSVTVE